MSLPGVVNVSLVTETGAVLSDYDIEAATSGPAGISFPLGVISYTSTVPPGDDSVTVHLTFTEKLPAPLILYKVDRVGVYSVLPTTVWTKIDDYTVEVTLTDGGPYDLDGDINGSVEDPIAPGGGRARDSGGGGCSLSTTLRKDPTLPILTLLSVTFLYRRRTRKAALRQVIDR